MQPHSASELGRFRRSTHHARRTRRTRLDGRYSRSSTQQYAMRPSLAVQTTVSRARSWEEARVWDKARAWASLVQPFVGCAYQMRFVAASIQPPKMCDGNVAYVICATPNASKHGGQPMREQGCRPAGLMPQHLCCHSSTQKVPPIEIRRRRDSSSSNRKRAIHINGWFRRTPRKGLPKMNAPDDLELTRNGAS